MSKKKTATTAYPNILVVVAEGCEENFERMEEALEHIKEYGYDFQSVEIREYECVKVHKVKLVTETKEVLKVVS